MPSDSLHPLPRVLGGSRGKSDRGLIKGYSQLMTPIQGK